MTNPPPRQSRRRGTSASLGPTGLVYLAAFLLATLFPGLASAELAADSRACLDAKRSEAVDPCERALARYPGDLAAERKLAWAYLATYHESEAVMMFRGIAERHPEDFQSQYDLAGVLLGLRAFHEAGPPVRQVLKLRPDDLKSLRLAGMFYELTGKQAEAFDIHLRLALAGVSVGMFDLAEDFALGRGTDTDQRRAQEWYLEAARSGHVLAMSTLAAKLERGAFGGQPDRPGAAFWRDKAKAARGR